MFNRLIAAALPHTPRFVVGRVARRYIAGETTADAVAAIRALNVAGADATVDVLGEFITDFHEAEATAAEYAAVLAAIEREKLRSNVSVKLTAFGLGLDAKRCLALVRALAQQAAAQENFVRVDMENSPYTDQTLSLVRTLRSEGLPVGVVVQAYLRRTAADVASLVRDRIPVRLCKGIYRESAEISFHDREAIRSSYRENLRALLLGHARVGIATHDELLVADAMAMIAELQIPKERYEFQMLLGVREWLRDEILQKGHDLRVYVPYGSAWYGYSVRRLRENPAIAGHVFKAMLGIR